VPPMPSADDLALLLSTLEQLILLEATEVPAMLTQMANRLAVTFRADKVDVFLYQPHEITLLALGTSDTPTGHLQRHLGLHCLPLDDSGRTGEVFRTGTPRLDTHVDQDPLELEGIKWDLQIRSAMIVPLSVAGTRRGVLVVSSLHPDYYTPDGLHFLTVVARWVGDMTHRAEIVEQLRAETEQHARRAAAEELLTVVAHDIKNFLSPLELSLTLLGQQPHLQQYPRDQAILSHARQALTYLNTLTTSLLDVARLDQGIFVIKPHSVEIVNLIARTVDALRIGGVEIRLNAPISLTASVDGVRVQLALSNLLANAVLHAGAYHPIEVTIRHKQIAEGTWVQVDVADRGPGIAPELLPHLFDRFTAGHQSAGLGIGLYIAKQIADAHGGTLTVSSHLGQGTTFHLAFPILPQD
jgi:two-component system OmpR family sensor kinase